MGYHYHNYEAYIEDDADFSLAKFSERLQKMFAQPNQSVALSANTITVTLDGQSFWIVYVNDGFIAEEADDLGRRKGRPALSRCSARLELYAEDDPNEIFYNEHLNIIDALCESPKLHVFDPMLGEFQN